MSRKATSATNTKSVKDAKAGLNKLLRKLDTVPTKVLNKHAQSLYGEIVARTPYKDGKLEKSVRVRVSKDKRRPGLLASASARAPGTGYNYAGIQHEDETFHHPIKGQAHFISEPFQETTAKIKAELIRELEV